MKIVNLTAHKVVVYADSEPILSVEPSGSVARLSERVVVAPPLLLGADGTVPAVRLEYADEVIDLPAPRNEVIFIVSRVLAAVVRRPDLYFPYEEVRDEAGRILGCRALGQFGGVPHA
jgi:hypothetical protein